MRHLIPLLLILSACAPGDLKPNAFGNAESPPPVTQTETPSILGEWTYYDGPPTNIRPQGMYFSFTNNGKFEFQKYHDVVSQGTTPAYVKFIYRGFWIQKQNNIEVTYDYPGCLAGKKNTLLISNFRTDGSTFVLDKQDGDTPITLVKGSILDLVDSKKPAITTNCNYAMKAPEEKRTPASAKVR